MQSTHLTIRYFSQPQHYSEKFEAMKAFTDARDPQTPDEIWLLQHHDVLTQGQAGKAEHILQHTHLPVVHTDRGGQVTWHGQGQLVVYFLLDLNRLKWHVTCPPRSVCTIGKSVCCKICSALPACPWVRTS